MNDLVRQGNAMRVVQTLEALRKVADPSSGGIPSAVSGGGGGGDHIGDSKPPRSTMKKKAESFIPATAATTETSTLNLKEISEVMGCLISCFFLSFFCVV